MTYLVCMLKNIGILKSIMGNSQITDSFSITHSIESAASKDHQFVCLRNQES